MEILMESIPQNLFFEAFVNSTLRGIPTQGEDTPS